MKRNFASNIFRHMLLMLSIASTAGATAGTKGDVATPALAPPPVQTLRATRYLLIKGGMGKLSAATMTEISAAASVQRLKLSAEGSSIAEGALRECVQVEVLQEEVPVSAVVRIDLSSLAELKSRHASQIADAAVDALANFYRAVERDSLESMGSQLRRLREKQARLHDEISSAGKEQEEVTIIVRKEAGLADASPEGVRAIAQKLEAENESARLELKAKSARHAALAEAIAKLTAQSDARAKDDPVAAELDKVVDVRMKEVERKQQMYGQKELSRSEVDEALGAVAEARARVMERRLAAVAAGGGDAVAAWNRELLSLSIDLAELRARSDALEGRLKELARALTALDRRASPAALQRKVEDASREMKEADERANELERDMSENQARVSVIKSSDEPVQDPPK